MNIDEDAMLVAIGQMDINEARDKYSDEWAEFCKKLTNWKSVHQLFRLAKLKDQMAKMMKLNASYQGQRAAYNLVANDIKTAIYKAMKEAGIEHPSEKRFLELYNKAEATIKEYPNDQRVKQSYESLKATKDKLDGLRKEKDEATGRIESTKIKYMEAKDEYDITKPYAMGLMVDDVLYSLSAALQGDIY